jgi:hypothetical protein
MPGGEDLFVLEYNQKDDIMIGRVQCAKVERAEADAIYNHYVGRVHEFPNYRDFILDVRKIESVSDPAIGVLMKGLDLMKKESSLAILLMTEALLQDIMLRHPEMFDFYAVFHTPEDAVAYIHKRRGEGK